MTVHLHALILEDRPADARMVVDGLLKAGFELDYRRADNEQEYLAHLRPDLDIILADYSMPQFTALQALALLQERGYDIPFIIISGKISEEAAVESIKQGGADYLLKDRLGRLGQAVTRALEEKQIREEKRRTEVALRRSEERYRLLLANIPDVTWTGDPEGKTIFISPNSENIFGYTPEEVYELSKADSTLFDRVHPEDVAHLREKYHELFAAGKAYDVEYRVRKKDGQWVWVHSRAMATLEQDGVEYAYGVTSDISVRKGLEAQLLQAQKMESVGRLAGGVAHDFNNLLTVIVGYCQLLRDSHEESDRRRDQLAEIEKAGKRAASLTRQLLALGRQQVMRPRVLNLNSIVADIQKMLRRLIGEDIDFETSLNESLGSVEADPGQIEQVIMNLAVNARDAMPNGGSLLIETDNVELNEDYAQHHPYTVPGSYIMIAVSDTGFGMDRDTQSHIFEPFYTTKEQGKGTGLGLSTVYGIVKQSGGYIEVYSELGQGTVFRIYLPRVDQAAEALVRVGTGPLPQQGSETILLVEDDQMVRTFALQVLTQRGYEVLAAASGREALSVSQEHAGQIELLLTDTVMPGMSGPQVAENLRRSRPGTKVIYMSGYTDEAVIRHGVLNERVHFIQKPFDPDHLGRKVRQVLNDDNATSS